MELFLIILFSYLMGSIPFGYILTKILLKKDIREIGSGNVGATNALRTGNKIIGYGTLLLDILKAIITIIFIKLNFADYLYISSLCVFIGHVFPIWLKFKGGKGVATYVGILFCINISSIQSYLLLCSKLKRHTYSYVRTSGFRATVTLFIVFYIINSTKY